MPTAMTPTEEDFDKLRRGLSRAGSEVVDEDELGEVTGPPTTAHWKVRLTVFLMLFDRVRFEGIVLEGERQAQTCCRRPIDRAR
jgi:hypothetical protein